ncbi:hypothetical protein Corgl_0986 [Coriobacterium glomerans PW2]|uniref:DUF4115 domain-containing protein n=1 Tax=Coriobacterium glomerans (strain ATCC 49209 / DSM 20642 / JCM 10262 / PW2) TaxID=700015 RepID=F2N7Y5_CORGP|nr:helix-turn-helix transcriptional regulator [Coriobacterium glomerans]AEB07094.1 hypothetical protein Corgl_0986 [Coriobacterium glomerans PW2]
MAARFGEMLLNRRRQMGLSIQQVANVIKIRPQIIEYFEAGNFAAMPPRGYAQGMISSYARYLGLNSRQIVEVYFDELYEYERLGRRRGGRLEGAAGLVRSRSGCDVRRRDIPEGDRSRSRFAQRPPQAGYVPESVSDHESIRLSNELASRRDQPVPPYANRTHERSTQALRSGRARGERTSGGDMQRVSGVRRGSNRAGQDRGLRPGRPRGGSSGAIQPSGRASAAGCRGMGRGAPAAPHRGPVGRAAERKAGLLSDRRVAIGGAALLLVILIALVLLLMQGCAHRAANRSGSARGAAASSQSAASSASSGGSASPDSSSTPASSGAIEEPQQPIVNVHVDQGATSWIEVKLDGKYVKSDNVIGPFDQSYTVTSTLEITVNTPDSVKVTKNGTEVKWSDKMAGVARMTITAPAPTSAASPDGSPQTGGAQATR